MAEIRTPAAMTVDASILSAVSGTADVTGLRAGPASETLIAAVREQLFARPVRWAVVAYAAELEGEQE